jgi:carboxy-terminal domain RNA polymerase II polypeptide A small phosphatase
MGQGRQGRVQELQDTVTEKEALPTDQTIERNSLRVPARISSQQQQPSPTSTKASGATATDSRNSSDGISKDSRGSMVGRQRNGSASSGVATGPTNTPGNSQPGSPASVPPRRKKGGGLLAMLGCCGVPDNAHAVDNHEENPPSHKLSTLPARPTTASRATASNQAGADSIDVAHPQFYEKEPNMNAHNGTDAPVRKTSTKRSSAPDHSTVGGGDDDSKQTTLVGAAGPVVTIDPPASAKGSEAEHSEGVKKDEDGDVEMPDAAGSAAGQVAQPAHDNMYTNTRPPPPPPGPVPSPPADQGMNAYVAGPALVAEESPAPQKSLLPPIRPEHRGRKCLVLDLDETLVHSSFKVRIRAATFLLSAADMHFRSFIRQI